MSDSGYRQIFNDGMWNNNVAFVQILGMCPLLAVSTTVVNGLGMGLATMATLVASNGLVSMIRQIVRPEIRIPVFVVIIASVVTVIELVMNAYFHQLYKILGIFIPLIVTNCSILGRAEAFASKNSIGRSLADGLFMGLGFTVALVLLGGLREVAGHGTLFAQIYLMFGHGADWLTTQVIPHYRGFLLAALPPGAFLGLGLLIALKNVIDQRLAERAAARESTPPAAQPAA
ncbi:MAG: electron transport complex subunit E [Gammaproteobacteria bacterium]